MKKILLFSAAIMLLISCEKDMNSSAVKNYADLANAALLSSSGKNDNNLDNKGKGDTKELKLSGSGTLSYIPGGCGSGTMQIKSSGTANSSHLGTLSQTTTVCLDPATGQIIAPVTGVATHPNGDQLNYLFVGAGIDAATGFQFQNYIFTGGTGKFEGATGNLHLLYQVRTPTNYAYTGEGTIKY